MVQLGERRAIGLLCYVNFLIFLNRGIIPGAPESFQAFISNSLDVPVSRQNFYLGLLSSIYVAATAVFSVLFGYLSLSRKPFHLIALGMVVWVAGAVVSGLAYYADSFFLLALGRVLGGFGEASFQCNATPFINRHAPKKNSTLWLGLFIASLTVGTPVGYIFGSSLAESSLTWAASFFVEGVLMLPAIVVMLLCVPGRLAAVPVEAIGDLSGALLTNDKTTVDPTFVRQWWRVFANIPFTLIALGYAAYTFTLGCFSTFSPTLLIGLGFFQTESDVSFVFGAVALVAGTVGTIFGSMVLDRLTAGNSVTPARRCKIAVDMLLYLMVVTTVCGLVMMLFTDSKTWYFVCLAITYLFMAVLGPAEMVAVMELFPESRQSMAIAANTVVILVFGDIPSPVVLGWLKDTWAPHCGTVEIDGDTKLNPDCYMDQSGLRHVLLFSVLWLIWGVLLWAAAKLVLRRKKEKVPTMIQSPAYTS